MYNFPGIARFRDHEELIRTYSFQKITFETATKVRGQTVSLCLTTHHPQRITNLMQKISGQAHIKTGVLSHCFSKKIKASQALKYSSQKPQQHRIGCN